jgi:hypothetical protein
MTENVESADDHVVLVECSSLSPLQRSELQALLERQPEVRQVTRRLHVTDALLNPDMLGVVAPRFDLVVHLAEGSRTNTGEATSNKGALILRTVAEWVEANRPRGKEQTEQTKKIIKRGRWIYDSTVLWTRGRSLSQR